MKEVAILVTHCPTYYEGELRDTGVVRRFTAPTRPVFNEYD